MNFIFSIKNYYFEKGTPWVELDKIKQRSWFLSVDIEDDEVVPCYDTVSELRLSKGIAFKSVKILTGKTQETHPYWEALLDMSYLNSTELRDVTFKDLPNESGIYMLNIWFDYDDEELNFGDNFKKLCEYRHKWDDGWVCSRCGVRKADWIEADVKGQTTTKKKEKSKKMNTTKHTGAETPKTACRRARSHIARLMQLLQDELADPDMTKDAWPVAGSLDHVRELLAEAVGFLRGVEGCEIVTSMVTKSR